MILLNYNEIKNYLLLEKYNLKNLYKSNNIRAIENLEHIKGQIEEIEKLLDDLETLNNIVIRSNKKERN